MPEAYKGLQSRAVGTTRAKVGNYNVPASTTALVVGLSVADVRNAKAIAPGDARTAELTIEVFDGTNYTAVCKRRYLDVNGTIGLRDLGDQIVLPTGGALFVTSGADAAVDVVMSVKEIS